MDIMEELEQLAEDELCHECSTPLTDAEKEQGYVCMPCIHGWVDVARHNN